MNIVHMNGRVYSPETGRFLSPDPLVQAPTYSQSFNRYSYVWNNPLNMIDPSGYAAKGSVVDTESGDSDDTQGGEQSDDQDKTLQQKLEDAGAKIGDIVLYQGKLFVVVARAEGESSGSKTSFAGAAGEQQSSNENPDGGVSPKPTPKRSSKESATGSPGENSEETVGTCTELTSAGVSCGAGENTRNFTLNSSYMAELRKALFRIGDEKWKFGKYDTMSTAIIPGKYSAVNSGISAVVALNSGGGYGQSLAATEGAVGIVAVLPTNTDNSPVSRGFFVRYALDVSRQNGGLPVFLLAPGGYPRNLLAVEFTHTVNRTMTGTVAEVNF